MGIIEQRRRDRIRRETIELLKSLKQRQEDHAWLNKDPDVRALIRSIVLAGM